IREPSRGPSARPHESSTSELKLKPASSHRFISAGPVDRRHSRAHRPQVSSELASMVEEIAEKSPRVLLPCLLHDLLSVEHERDRPLPTPRFEFSHPFRHTIVMAIVRVEDFLDGRWRWLFGP